MSFIYERLKYARIEGAKSVKPFLRSLTSEENEEEKIRNWKLFIRIDKKKFHTRNTKLIN